MTCSGGRWVGSGLRPRSCRVSPRQGHHPPCPHTPFSHGPFDTLGFTCGLTAACPRTAAGQGARPGAAGWAGPPLLQGLGWAGAGLIPRQNPPPPLRASCAPASPLSQPLAQGGSCGPCFPGRRPQGLPGQECRQSCSPELPATGLRSPCPGHLRGQQQRQEAGWVLCEGSISLPRT